MVHQSPYRSSHDPRLIATREDSPAFQCVRCHDGIEPKIRTSTRTLVHIKHPHATSLAGIKFRGRTFVFNKRWKLLQLCARQSGIDVGQPVIEPNDIVNELPRMFKLCGGRQMFGLRPDEIIVSNQAPAAAASNGLIAVETERSNQTRSASV